MKRINLAAQLLSLSVVGVLLHRVRALQAEVADVAGSLSDDEQIRAVPEAHRAAFDAGADRVITIEILNPLELAASQVRAAGPAGSVAPELVRRQVYARTVAIIEEQLAAQGAVAEVRIRAAR